MYVYINKNEKKMKKKNFPAKSNLQNKCCLKLDFQKVD